MLGHDHGRFADDTYPEPYRFPDPDEEYERWVDEQERDAEWVRMMERGDRGKDED